MISEKKREEERRTQWEEQKILKEKEIEAILTLAKAMTEKK